jgi:hypothetical protein
VSRWTQTIALDSSRLALNGALKGARYATMLQILGNPRGHYSSECKPPENRRLRNLLVTRNAGPFRVQGIRPAVDTLEAILADVKAAEPDVHSRLGHVGMLCCRLVRGSSSAISNHSWGTAIDLRIAGVLDSRGNSRAQRGLMQIYKYFNRHEFFWGVAFPTEDAMHFEASDQLIRRWHQHGMLGDAPAPPADDDTLEIGDRSAAVAELQRMLAKTLSIQISRDGIFGAMTRAAVIDFQRRHDLTADGRAGPCITLAKLREVTS